MPSALRQQRRYNLTPARRKITGPGASAQQARRTPIKILSFSHTLGVGTVTFDQPVVLDGLPGWTDSASHTVTAAVMASATVMTITFSGTITTPVTVPFEDPALRNNAAGYVQAGSQVVT